jgi:hypothetical protein
MLGSAFIFRTNSSALVFIVFGTLSNISSSIASFVFVSITAGGDVDTLDTTRFLGSLLAPIASVVAPLLSTLFQ